MQTVTYRAEELQVQDSVVAASFDSGNGVKEVTLPQSAPASFLLLVNGRVMLPTVDYSVSNSVLQFMRPQAPRDTIALLNLDGSLAWAFDSVVGVLFPIS